MRLLPEADGSGGGKMGTERPKSKRRKDTAGASLSLWALLARSSFYKILAAVALLAAGGVSRR